MKNLKPIVWILVTAVTFSCNYNERKIDTYDNIKKDYLGNAVVGNNVIVIDATHNIVHADNKKLVLLQGLDEFVVVDTKDVLLICKKDKEQEIKEYVAEVKRNKGDKYL